jgi:hypothetical protein
MAEAIAKMVSTNPSMTLAIGEHYKNTPPSQFL